MYFFEQFTANYVSSTDNQIEPQPSDCSKETRIEEANMLTLTIQRLGDVSVFQCAGRITAGDGDILRIALRTQSRVRTVVLDLSEISAVDAAGLGMLVSLRTWAKTTGTELKLMNITPRVEEVLQLTKLRSAFEVCSVREMMDLLCRASRTPDLETPAAAVEPRPERPTYFPHVRI